MARSNGYAITGNELQAMVNEHILLAKSSIPATDRCLTNAEVYNSTYVYQGSAPSGTFLPTTATFPPIPTPIDVSNFLANFTNINPVGSQSVQFEMSQVGNPYLNVDLFGYVNGIPLRLDPGSNLDGLFFGGPQYSPQMNQYIDVGNILAVQANFGRDDQETPGNWGWSGGGYGVLEIYQNGVLVNMQTTGWRPPSAAPNLSSLTYTLTVQPGINYYVKAYAVLGVNDTILNCGNQMTHYVEPSEVVDQDYYVGPGPAMIQVRQFFTRRYYSPGQYPTSGTVQVSGSTNSWWFGQMLTGNVVLERNGAEYSGNAFPDLTPSTAADSVNGWTFIPRGQDTIKLKLYGGSPDTVWEISTYIGCTVPGDVLSLHWSPDTAAHACDSNYSYYFFDGSETTITGFTGYRQYFVSGGWQVGGRISAYPTGTATITANVPYGVGGKLVHTYPNYSDSIPSVTYYMSNVNNYNQLNSWGGDMTQIHTLAQPGYYSDGTNWALVGDSTATTGYNDGIIIEVGTCQGPLTMFEVGQTYFPENKCSNNNDIIYIQAYGTSITVGMQLYDASGNLIYAFANPGEYWYLKDTTNSNTYYVNNNGIVEYIELCPSYPPAGIFVNSYCGGWNGTDLYYRYTNGSGGYYDQLWQSNSTQCGGDGGPGIEEFV
jgi:hypothetical protein